MKSLTKLYRELSVIVGIIIASCGINHAGDLTGYDTDGDGQIDYLDDSGNLWPNQQAWEESNAYLSAITGDEAEAAATVEPPLDSDGDGLADEEEAALGTNPLVVDTDGGGVNDYDETYDEDWRATDPLNPADDMPTDYAPPGEELLQADEGIPDDVMQTTGGADGENFWTWGNVLGIIGGILTIVGLIVESPVIGFLGVIVFIVWLVFEIIDYFEPGPGWNDGDFPDYPPQPVT